MGLLDKFFRSSINTDGVSQLVISRYGGKKSVQRSYDEVGRLTSKKFKETLDINDQILEKYARINNEDIQAELMKKYLKISQDDLNKIAIEQEQQENHEIDEQVDQALKGQDKNTKEQVKEDVKKDEQKDKQEGKDVGKKDKKEALQTKIYEATYNKMYKDYASRVMTIKDAQFSSMAVALTSKEAVEILAMEKNLEKIDLLYHNHTGKNIDDVKRIKQEKKDFKNKFEYNQKGIESNTNARASKISLLYKKREKEYMAYILALKDPAKSPQEKALYKRSYQEANLELIQSIPSLSEYTKGLEIQEKNEQAAKDKNLGATSAVNNKISSDKQKEQKVTESDMAHNIYNIKDSQEKREIKNFEMSRIHQKDLLEKNDIASAKQIGDSQRDKRVYDENIERIPNQSTYSQTKKDVEEKQEIGDSDFFSSLRKVNNIEDRSSEELKSIIDDVDKDAQDKIKENAYKEQIKQETEYQRYRKQNKKPNG